MNQVASLKEAVEVFKSGKYDVLVVYYNANDGFSTLTFHKRDYVKTRRRGYITMDDENKWLTWRESKTGSIYSIHTNLVNEFTLQNYSNVKDDKLKPLNMSEPTHVH